MPWRIVSLRFFLNEYYIYAERNKNLIIVQLRLLNSFQTSFEVHESSWGIPAQFHFELAKSTSRYPKLTCLTLSKSKQFY